ncbi:MAG: hypothetical protein IJ752_06905 [Alphaproteobacteria bacterium]|nr:hypothetical protein [Alphaproteobacteria bacterium]
MKTFFVFLLLSCSLAFNAQAEQFLSNDSFQLAKAFKLGRDTDLGGGFSASRLTVKSKNSYQTSSSSSARQTCDSNCKQCDARIGQCHLCKTGFFLNNNRCIACPENSSCSGRKFTCDAGFFKQNLSCLSCNTLSVENGFCDDCNDKGECTLSGCYAGYYKADKSCLSCSSIKVENGTCKNCDNEGICTDFSCDYQSTFNGTSCVKDVIWSPCNPYNNEWGGINGRYGWTNSTGAHSWNYDGEHTIPSDAWCWDGYGMTATINVPDGANYPAIAIRFWSRVTVNGSFSTKYLNIDMSSHNTGGTKIITFNDPVTAEKIIFASKLGTLVFNGGLNGNPSCAVKDGWCHCTATKCVIDG